jgi:hypothetical protein
MTEQMYIVYDERAAGGDTDDALALCTAKTLHEARRDVQRRFPRGVIYRYDVESDPSDGSDILLNESFIEGPT